MVDDLDVMGFVYKWQVSQQMENQGMAVIMSSGIVRKIKGHSVLLRSALCFDVLVDVYGFHPEIG
ncbi:hypothetical protein PO417_23985, partial [Escherichia coli]